jgi:hypothetical protein
MKETEDNLSRALRDLAASVPECAPPEVGAGLERAFARHHIRRRRRRRMLLVATAALCAGAAVSSWRLAVSPARQGRVARQTPAILTSTPGAGGGSRPQVEANASVPRNAEPLPRAKAEAATGRARPGHAVKARSYGRNAVRPASQPEEFVALSSFDPAVPMGQFRIVRLELSGSALQLVGLPAGGELLNQRVLTDLLVGQDGVPYAVRLIRSRSIQP